MNAPPAEIGMPLEEVDTPALLVDLDAFEHNLRRLAEEVETRGIRLRPHAKTHKCAVVGQQQVALGAVGLCCQKVSEAEAMVNGGICDVLVSNQVVGKRKINRLMSIAGRARMSVCVDDAENVADLSAAAVSFGVELTVLVEIDVMMGRCGVPPGRPALELARVIDKSPGLTFGGLQAYHGGAQHIRGYEDRGAAIQAAIKAAVETKTLLEDEGLACPSITGAGTGSYQFESQSGVYTELQCGSYVFMDADYGRNLDEAGNFVSDFRNSLFIYTTVMSVPTRNRAICDAGLKSMAFDSGMPSVVGEVNVVYDKPSDEHGTLNVKDDNRPLRLGDKIKLIPGHCDPTVNLHDWYVGVRGERVEALWPIVARGALW